MNSAKYIKSSLDDRIDHLLKAVTEEEGLCNCKIEKSPGSAKGDGYLGVITAVVITGEVGSGKPKTLHLIVKSATKNDAVRAEAPISDVFIREVFMYNKVIPAFQRFEKEKGLPKVLNLAKCYKACIIDKSEALILENLKKIGYSVWEKKFPMEHEHVSLVMKQCAHFHALSFALKDQKPEVFKELTDNMSDMFAIFIGKSAWAKLFENQCRKGLSALHPILDKIAYSKFERLIGEVDQFLGNLPNLVDKYSAILHGDCWTNNMMFKYEDKNNSRKPTKMCFLDFQLSRMGPPVLDLTYYFYACCSKTVLDNYKDYMRIYHASLSQYLCKLGSDPERVYPYSVLEEQWRKWSRFGLICAMLLMHAMLSEQDESIDFTEIAESGKSVMEAFDYDIANEEVYIDRVRHIIFHFMNNGFL